MIEQTKPLITEDDCAAVDEYMRSGGWLTEFKKTRELEETLAAFLGVQHCILVPSGTVALSLACMVFTPGKRKKVIVPDMTMIATANAALLAGLEVEFCDVDAYSLCLDAWALNNMGSQRNDIAGIIYVDFNGRASDLEDVQRLCRQFGWFFVEDACQAFGSKYNGNHLGTFGDIGCFSLSPHKIITTGQGGFLVTDNDFYAKKIRELKDFGRRAPGLDDHVALGYNYKFTDLQAVIGLSQMKNIDWRIQRKKEIYDAYYVRMHEYMIKREEDHTPWFVDVYAQNVDTSIYRDNWMCALGKKNIGCRPMYPPLHTQAPYNTWISAPKSECISRTGLWLPSYLDITDKDISYVCDALHWM